jgi:endonuclease/exonuclease/phosphatase family metal-dependent hydrolase
VDFHVIAVHARSGATAAARADRLTVLRRLDDAVAPLRRADEDMVILGNFNTMGDMTPGSAEAELQTLFTTAATGEPGFVRLTVTPACTGYHQGRPSWRDHVLVSRSMTEVPPSAVGRPTSYCALRACEPMGRQRPAAYQELSSHCPVVVELVNRDED